MLQLPYWLSAGKNKRAITTAKNPNTMKSYYSRAFPITAAATWSGLGANGVDDMAFLLTCPAAAPAASSGTGWLAQNETVQAILEWNKLDREGPVALRIAMKNPGRSAPCDRHVGWHRLPEIPAQFPFRKL